MSGPWWTLGSDLGTPFRCFVPPLGAGGQAGADSMSHDLGLESWREAPPLLGPLLSPFSPRRLWLLPDAALQSPVPHHQFRWVRGSQGRCSREERWRGERLRGPQSGRLQPGWRQSWCGVKNLSREPEPGQREGGEERRGLARAATRAAASSGAAGCGAGGGPSPGISGDRVTEFTEWGRSGTAGLAAGTGPRSPPPPTVGGRRQRRPWAH